MALLTAAKETDLKDMETFRQLVQKRLEQRISDLRNEILDLLSVQKAVLHDKLHEIQKTIKLINDSITQARNTTQTGEVSKLKSICDSLKEPNEKTHSTWSHLDLGEDYLVFDANKAFCEFTKCLCTLDQPYFRGFLPTMIRLQAMEVKVGLKTELKVDIHNYHWDQVSIPFDSFSLWIIDPTGAEIPTGLCTSGPECTVTFTPKVSGLHQVRGLFLGQQLISEQTHIPVSNNNPVLKFGRFGNGKGTFKLPWGIAIDNNDNLYVAHLGNRLIQKFSANEDYLRQFTVSSHDTAPFNMALDLNSGILFSSYGILMDGYNGRSEILAFNFDGQLKHKCNLIGLSNAFSTAINSLGDLFILDINKKCLVK